MTFRDEIEQQALAARRQMLRTGELLTEDEFRKRLQVSDEQLTRMISRGDVFTIEVDGVDYFPSLLAASGPDLRRLHSICRVLVPAPPSCKLGYLTSKQANVGDILPLDALRDEKQYRRLRAMARAYAAEWWRTVVTIYAGRYAEEPRNIEPALTAVDEVDPRVGLWKRAGDALQSGGYIRPSGPYAEATEATVFVARHPAGRAPPIPEARIDVRVVDGIANAVVASRGGLAYALDSLSAREAKSIVDVVIQVVLAARKRESARRGEKRQS